MASIATWNFPSGPSHVWKSLAVLIVFKVKTEGERLEVFPTIGTENVEQFATIINNSESVEGYKKRCKKISPIDTSNSMLILLIENRILQHDNDTNSFQIADVNIHETASHCTLKVHNYIQ